MVLVSDGLVFVDEANLVKSFEASHGLGDAERAAALAARGWTAAEWDRAPNYGLLLRIVLADGVVEASEIAVVASYEAQHGVTERERRRALGGLGWTVDKFLERAPPPEAPAAAAGAALDEMSRSVRARVARSRVARVDAAAARAATGGFDDARLLGSGGFGAVYEASLEQFGAVAIKRVAPGAAGAADFARELDALARLRDPRLVHLLAYAVDGDERILVLELMRGGSLRDRLACAGADAVPLPWDRRVRVALDASAALYFLHNAPADAAFVHGDVKSANILLDGSGRAKLADFGLARALSAPGAVGRTATLAGSHGYMDPHYVATGEVSAASDARARARDPRARPRRRPPALRSTPSASCSWSSSRGSRPPASSTAS